MIVKEKLVHGTTPDIGFTNYWKVLPSVAKLCIFASLKRA